MIVVFDTNIWKSNLYLRAGAAAAVRFYLQQEEAKIGLPEVVRLEVEHHLRAEMRNMRDRIRQDHQRLLGMMGQLKDITLPSDDRIEEVVTAFIDGLGFELVEAPLSMEAARSSFLRTIDKIPPSHKSQQFKDGILWADCLAWAQSDNVTLVTGDRAFYEDDDPKKSLAPELLRETASLSHRLRVVRSLAELLPEIKKPVKVSDETLIDAIYQQLGADISGILERLAFAMAGEPIVKKTFYATEKPRTLFVEFRLEVACEDTSAAGRVDAALSVAGDGQYNTQTLAFVDLSPRDIRVVFKTPNGVEEERRGVYMRASPITIGTPTIEHQVREPL